MSGHARFGFRERAREAYARDVTKLESVIKDTSVKMLRSSTILSRTLSLSAVTPSSFSAKPPFP